MFVSINLAFKLYRHFWKKINNNKKNIIFLITKIE